MPKPPSAAPLPPALPQLTLRCEKTSGRFVRAPRRVGRCIRAGADRPGNVAPCLSSHDTGWEYAIEVTNDGKVVPLRRRDDGNTARASANTSWANARDRGSLRQPSVEAAALPSSALTRQALPAPVLAWHPGRYVRRGR